LQALFISLDGVEHKQQQLALLLLRHAVMLLGNTIFSIVIHSLNEFLSSWHLAMMGFFQINLGL